MWYRTDLLFAKPKADGTRTVQCESCNVLFEAHTAVEAIEKAERWAARHVDGSDFQLVGLENITSLFEDKPGDGTEIGGMYFEDEDVWERKADLIPERSKIPVIQFEQNPDVPVKQLIVEAQTKGIREIFGED